MSAEIYKHTACPGILHRMYVQDENGVFSKGESSVNVNSCEESSYAKANTSMPKRPSHEGSLVSPVGPKAFLSVFVK